MLTNLTNLFGHGKDDDDIWTWIIIGAVVLLLLLGDKDDDPCHEHDGFLGGLFEGNGIIILILLALLLFIDF